MSLVSSIYHKVEHKYIVVVSQKTLSPTGSSKTTLSASLAKYIPEK
jgi:hypothetical protein